MNPKKGAWLDFNRHGVNTLMTSSPPECQEKTTVIRISAFGFASVGCLWFSCRRNGMHVHSSDGRKPKRLGAAIYLDWLQGVLRYNLPCLSPIKWGSEAVNSRVSSQWVSSQRVDAPNQESGTKNNDFLGGDILGKVLLAEWSCRKKVVPLKMGPS